MMLVKKRYLAVLAIAAAFVFSAIVLILLNDRPSNMSPTIYSYDTINRHPHDQNAFTQGLVFDDGVLYESTGLYGHSTLRCVEIETGEILRLYNLPNQFFGEGITIFDDKIIQLTWRSNRGFVYDKDSFDLL
jgi:glutamine cyclotransferase